MSTPSGAQASLRRLIAGAFLGGALVGGVAAVAQTDDLAALKEKYRRPTAIPFPSSNSYSEAKRMLGESLFHDKRLSADGTHACATCHDRAKGFSDGRVTAVGVLRFLSRLRTRRSLKMTRPPTRAAYSERRALIPQLSLPASIEHIKAGKLRALAVTTAKHSDALPNLPSVSEFVAGYEASGWNGLCAPKNTPAEIVEKLNGAVRASLADPKLRGSAWGMAAILQTRAL